MHRRLSRLLPDRSYPAVVLLSVCSFLSTSSLTGSVFRELIEGEINNNGTVVFTSTFEDPFTRALLIATRDGELRALTNPDAPSPISGYRYKYAHLFDLNSSENVVFADILEGEAPPHWALPWVFFYQHAQGTTLPMPNSLSDYGLYSPMITRLILNDSDQALISVMATEYYGARVFLFDARTSELQLLVEEGDSRPGGGRYAYVQGVDLNDQGDALISDSGPVKLIDGFGRLYRKLSGQQVELVVAADQPLPGTAGVLNAYVPRRYPDIGLFLAQIDDSGAVIFAAKMDGVPDSLGGLFEFNSSGAPLTPLALDNQEVGGATFQWHGSCGVVNPTCFKPPMFVVGSEFLFLDGWRLNLQQKTWARFIDPAETVVVSGLSLTPRVALDRMLTRLLISEAGKAVLFASGVDGTLNRQALFVRDAFTGESSSILTTDVAVAAVPGGGAFTAIYPESVNDSGDVLFLGSYQYEGASQTGFFVFESRNNTVRRIAVPGEMASSNIPATRLVFPQFADGVFADGSIRTQLLLVNPSDFATNATVRFFASDSQPLVVTLAGQTATSFDYSIPANGSVLLETAPTAGVQAGYVVVESAGQLTGSEIFTIRDQAGTRRTEVGVLPSTATRQFLIGVEAQDDVNTGLALVNLGASAADISLEAFGADGTSVGTRTVTLPAGEHIAQYIAGEIFEDIHTLIGKVRVTSSSPVYKTVLRQTGSTLTSFPAIDLVSQSLQ